MSSERGLYVLMMSVHGLVRSTNLELGRDADTGGQVSYVVELARALAADPAVDRVDLLTRQIFASNIDPIYAQPIEKIAPKANLVRIPCGPRRYLYKERLWPYLDAFVDGALRHIRDVGRVPDVVHGHYADAGYVGAELVGILGLPLVFTGHSLGRVKQDRLIQSGMSEEAVELRYNITRRIEAEELAINSAALVVTSTHQEAHEQYAGYDRYIPERMTVIPPGVDLSRFSPPGPEDAPAPIAAEIDRFLSEPKKPLILAMARPDERKNLEGLLKAYARNEELKKAANLAIVAGNREDMSRMDRASRAVLSRLLYLIDLHDLYGRVAYPKQHDHDDVPDLYRLAALRRGVFVNPAFTEPFGLTLIEAAASGLPVVATEDGGPKNIVGACRNGILVDPLNPEEISAALLRVVRSGDQWEIWSKSGVRGAVENFTWASHTRKYLDKVREVIADCRSRKKILIPQRSRLPMIDRLVVTNVDDVLDFDDAGRHEFLRLLDESPTGIGFCISTGRCRDDALWRLGELGVPTPDILISRAGTEIYVGPNMVLDRTWERKIDFRWHPEEVRDVLDGAPGLCLQENAEQGQFKISYDIDRHKALGVHTIVRMLRRASLSVRVLQSFGVFLDVIPIRASPGLAIRHLGIKLGVAPDKMLVVGLCGADARTLRGNTLGIVPANHTRELERLRGHPQIYFAENAGAAGLVEGIDRHAFFGKVQNPQLEAGQASGAVSEFEDPSPAEGAAADGLGI